MATFFEQWKSPAQERALLNLERLSRISGTEIFLFTGGSLDWTRFFEHAFREGWLATQVLLVVPTFADAAHVDIDKQAQAYKVAQGILVVTISFGAMDSPKLLRALNHCPDLRMDPATTTYLVDDQWVDLHPSYSRWTWRRRLHSLIGRSTSTARLFDLPASRLFAMHPC